MVWGREFWLILFHVGISSGSQRQLLKSSVLSSLNYVDSFVENEWPLMKGLCLNSPFCFIDLCIYLDASTTQIYDCSYVVSFEVMNWLLQFCSFLRMFWLFQVLWSPTWILEWDFLFLQKRHLILMGTALICRSLWAVLTF